MSTVMACEELEYGIERSQSYLAAFADDPNFLSFSVDGIDFYPVIDSLDEREAGFVSTKYFDLFYEGQMIGPAVLSLQDVDSVVVYPVVKSKNWPLINVEFLQISSRDRQMIGRALATSAGGRRPPTPRRKFLATTP